MGMPEATKEQLKHEVTLALGKHGIVSARLVATLMETVVKAWYFGRDTGYREVIDKISNGEYFN